jgi:hypothetical protein
LRNTASKSDVEGEIVEHVDEHRHLVEAEVEGVEQGIGKKDGEDHDKGRKEY